MSNLSSSWLLSLLLASALAPAAAAHDAPGSILVFPEFDSRIATSTILTVTNTNPDVAVRAEFVYIHGADCLETNRLELLTPNDTFTTLASFHNPNQEEGFLYVVARSATTGAPVHFNWLIGQALTVNGVVLFDYSYNPYTYRAVNAGGPGTSTNVDGDSLRDLNGIEYEASPDQLLVPRFLGQGPAPLIESELVLINLTGGKLFDAVVDFLVDNDNEEVFSAQYKFRCWERESLLDISGVFSNAFLHDGTSDDPEEIGGAPSLESGWMRIDGQAAFSSAASFANPAILAVLNERVALVFGSADLPYGAGANVNGDLLGVNVLGDSSP